MAVITISQGTFSGARMLAAAVSRRLGYRCIDRDQLLSKAAAQWGVSQENLRAAFEGPPRFFGQSQRTKYVYLALIQATLTEEVRGGNTIYDGLAGLVLRNESLRPVGLCPTWSIGENRTSRRPNRASRPETYVKGISQQSSVPMQRGTGASTQAKQNIARSSSAWLLVSPR